VNCRHTDGNVAAVAKTHRVDAVPSDATF
jgi:hypothetical protein